jgi:hypothetical protein
MAVVTNTFLTHVAATAACKALLCKMQWVLQGATIAAHYALWSRLHCEQPTTP